MISFRTTALRTGPSRAADMHSIWVWRRPDRLFGVGSLLCSTILAAGGMLAGCANPGVPRPPSLHLPAAVTDLTAERIGDRVELRWTSPKRTTDGLELTATTFMTAEICRDPAVPTAPAPTPKTAARAPASLPVGKAVPIACTPVLRVPNQQGGSATPSTVEDQLPAHLSDEASAGTYLAYRVKILNAKGRSADPSGPIYISAGPAVEKVEDFSVSQTSQGVVLAWRGNPAARGSVEVLRTVVTPPGSAPAAPQKVSPAKRRSGRPPGGQSRQAARPGEVQLRQEASADGTVRRPDGMVDEGAVLEQTYRYRAYRVAVVQVAGRSLEVRSEATAPVTVERLDTFAPAPPRGLESVPGLLHDPADATIAKTTIDLSWQPGVEPDLAGYNVYRVDLGAGPGANLLKLNQSTVPGPAYRDVTAVPGHRYRYAVTAVDRIGNESKPGIPVEDVTGHP